MSSAASERAAVGRSRIALLMACHGQTSRYAAGSFPGGTCPVAALPSPAYPGWARTPPAVTPS